MSPNVGNFVHDLVEMAKATEELPKFQAEVERLSGMVENYAKQVQDREIAIIGYKEEIETLHAKVRSLEVERDDASFRVLEAEDNAAKVIDWARDTQTLMGHVISTLDPPKPEPVKEPEPQAQPVATPTEGQSASDPTVTSVLPQGNANAPIQQENASQTLPDAVHSIQETGQSESFPTTSNENTSTVSGEAKSSTNPTLAASSPEPTELPYPYLGKRYFDIPGYVSRYDWEQGGGTEEDYNWRPAPPIASGSY